MMGLQNQGKQDNKRKQKRPLCEPPENQTAGCLNKCFEKTNFTTSHVIFVVVGSKHVVEEKLRGPESKNMNWMGS